MSEICKRCQKEPAAICMKCAGEIISNDDESNQREYGPSPIVQFMELVRSLDAMMQLWDGNHPEDPCACLAKGPDDITEPLPCELCEARALLKIYEPILKSRNRSEEKVR